MNYRPGVLGVVVIIVAISATLMGSWVMSMDVDEVKVTKYNPLADIVGEFDTQQTPTWTDYNPSTNYTGYFTDNSIIDGVTYFDGVDYTPSKPNNYRINPMPLDSVQESKTITTSEGSVDSGIVYIRTAASTEDYGRAIQANYVKMSSLLSSWSYSDYNKINIKNPNGNIDWYDYSSIEGSWVAFIPASWLEMHTFGLFLVIKNPDLTVKQVQDLDPILSDYVIRDPTMACQYDKNSESVQVFYDIEMKNSAGSFRPDEVIVLFGQSTSEIPPELSSLITSNETMGLGSVVNVTALKLPDATYLDPSAGVVMS